MPAGTIHAVLTPERSMLTSAFIAVTQEVEVVRSTVEWEIDLQSRWTTVMRREWAEQSGREYVPWSHLVVSRTEKAFFNKLLKVIEAS